MSQSTCTTSVGRTAGVLLETQRAGAVSCPCKILSTKQVGLKQAARRAFSLIEVVLVLVLMLALAAMAVPAVNWIIDSFAQKQVIEMVQAAALEARAEVMRQGTAAQLTVVEESASNRINARSQTGSTQQSSASRRSSSVVLRFAPQTHENMFTDPELLESVDESAGGDGSGTKKGRTQSIFELPPGWRILNRLPTQALLPPTGASGTSSQDGFVMDDESTVGGSPIVLAILLPSGEVGSKESSPSPQLGSMSMSEDQALPFASRDGLGQSDATGGSLTEDDSQFALAGSSTRTSPTFGRQGTEASQVESSDTQVSETQNSKGLYLIGPKGQAWLMSFSRWTGELVMKEVAMSDRTGSQGSLREQESLSDQEETLNESSDSSAAFEPTLK